MISALVKIVFCTLQFVFALRRKSAFSLRKYLVEQKGFSNILQFKMNFEKLFLHAKDLIDWFCNQFSFSCSASKAKAVKESNQFPDWLTSHTNSILLTLRMCASLPRAIYSIETFFFICIFRRWLQVQVGVWKIHCWFNLRRGIMQTQTELFEHNQKLTWFNAMLCIRACCSFWPKGIVQRSVVSSLL